MFFHESWVRISLSTGVTEKAKTSWENDKLQFVYAWRDGTGAGGRGEEEWMNRFRNCGNIAIF